MWRDRQGAQVVVGRALALEVGGVAVLRAQRRQLQHLPDAGPQRGLEQRDRRAAVDAVEIAAAAFDQDADRIDDDVDAAQAVHPVGGGRVGQVVHGDLVLPAGVAHAPEHPVAIAR